MGIRERDHRIDNLRCIGTLLVILAHMSLPQIILNLRTFDVILLVMVSYITFRFKSSSNDIPYSKYILKRIKRLVVPAYVMLSIFFILSELLSFFIQHTHAFDIKTIISSFLFLESGIPYIWIVRIFVVIAFFAPIISSLTDNTALFKNRIRLICAFVASVLLILVGGAVYNYFSFDESLMIVVLRSWIVVPLIYVAVTQIISVLLLLNKRNKIVLFVLLSFLVLLVVVKGDIIAFNPDDYKTPPQLYWIVYGLIVSVVFYMLVPNKRQSFFEFVSVNSLNIYLVHIVLLMFYNKFLGIHEISASSFHLFLSFWFVRYVIVLGLSLLMVYVWPYLKKILTRIK